MATISDISNKAGVAKSTVSRYLNNGYVSERTKEKIEAAIKEFEYIPNSYAQSLRSESNRTVGVIIPRFDSYSVTTTLQGIDEELKRLNYNILIENTNMNAKSEIEYLKRLAKLKVSGIIFLATNLSEEHISTIYLIDVPVIVIGQYAENLNCIIYKDYEAAYDLASQLATYDFSEIAYLGVTEDDEAVGLLRKNGFIDRLKQGKHSRITTYYTDFSIESAKQKTAELLEEKQPELLICATDNIAIGAMNAIHNKKLRIPEDISITGFGGHQISNYLSPSLTTIQYDYKHAGSIAAKNVVMLTGKEVQKKVIKIGYQIFMKESVDKINFSLLD
ncbi:LacI family DNA-binding transcriptional regulator [Lentibacillus sp. L22]|uniref:LacI family DNA-binding transcriptional regulator n=1 Tax=Lentibacillus sp. L22 TaxID=3163028 RepID=UPI0034675EE5